MSLDNVTLRAATLDDLAGIAAIYNQLWCNTLRNRGDVEAADFCARFNIAMQLQRSPSHSSPKLKAASSPPAASASSRTASRAPIPRGSPAITRCSPRQPRWQRPPMPSSKARSLAIAARRQHADRFAATGNEYAQGQLNLIIIVPEWQGKGLGRRAHRPCARRARQGRLHQILPDERLQLRLAVLRAPQHEAHPRGPQPRHR